MELSFTKIISPENSINKCSLYPQNRKVVYKSTTAPPHLIKNIPFGQFQRLRRICDKESDFNSKAVEMKKRFSDRGYKHSELETSLHKVKVMDRKSLLCSKQKRPQKSNVYFVSTYSKQSTQICNIIKRNWGLLHSDPAMKEIFPGLPTCVSRRAPTLQNKLVRSHLPPKKTWLQKPIGNFPCGHCTHCSNIPKTNMFTDVFTKHVYKINHFANCNTSFIVYRLECPCGCFYVGRTKRKFKDRLGEHKTAIRTANPNYPMAMHYQEKGHGGPDSLQAVAIEAIPNDGRGGDRLKKLLQRETFWIVTLQATVFPGLNDEVDFLPFL